MATLQEKDTPRRETGMQQVKTKLSTVVDELRELDLRLKEGSNLDAVEKGFSHKLIHAISSKNELLECEALKSLGDLYLQKTKIKNHKAENFSNACALYREVLRHDTLDEQKEVIEHRIKYAEKCAKLVHDPKRAEAEIVTSRNMTLTVSRTLQEVTEKTKMKGQCVVPLIWAYTNFLVKAVMNRNTCLGIECLKGLGDLYVELEKGRVGKDEAAFTKAANLYRAALDRCEDTSGRETLEHRIKYTEKVRTIAMEKRQNQAQTGNRKASKGNVFTPPQTSHQPLHSRTSKLFQDLDTKVTNLRLGHSESTEEDTDRTYRKNLQEGCRALQTGDLDRAEENFAAALKVVSNNLLPELTTSAHAEGQHIKEAEPLYKLSEVYLKRGTLFKDGSDFTKAAALCNAALVRSRRKDISKAIHKITRLFVRNLLNIQETVEIGDTKKHKLMLKKHRDYVKHEITRIEQQIDPYTLDDDDPNLTEAEKKRAEAIKALFQTIGDQRITFITGLVNECMEVMGPPPCRYAMIGLGSQATGLVTPYSDLEFAILIEKETDNNVTYFRNLTHYLHLKVINLGETILPAMGIKSLNDFHSDSLQGSWFYDSVTPRGFSFDGAMPHACKTPLGRGRNNTARSELIQTPKEMNSILTNDLTLHLKKGYHLANVLGNVCLITGDQDLVDVYTDLWTQQLQENNGSTPLLIAKTALDENASTFGIHDLKTTLLNVKKDIYRFSSLAVSCLALLHNIQPTTIWETIQKLNMNGVINNENAHHLMVMASISAELRLRTYMTNGGQVENMSALSSMLTDKEIGDKVKRVFYYSNTKQLMRYYFTARPLKRAISELTDIESQVDSRILFDDSPRLKAEVYKSLCDYENHKSWMERALQNELATRGRSSTHPDIADYLQDMGLAWRDFGCPQKAVSYLEQSLRLMRINYSESTPHIAMCLNNLGLAWKDIGDYRKAASYHEQSLKMMRRLWGESSVHPVIAMVVNNLGVVLRELGYFKEALEYHEQALQMRLDYHAMSKSIAHPDIAMSFSNLGSAWSDLGDHMKAVFYYESSLQIMRSIYGETAAHPDVANTLNSLGAALWEHGDHRKAVRHYDLALRMLRRIYGKITPRSEVAGVLDNLGSIWMCLGDCRKAISYHEQSLQMRLSIYGEGTKHHFIAESLNNLGLGWRELGDHKKAVGYFEQSFEMLRCIYGKDVAHRKIAQTHENLVITLADLGENRKAVSSLDQVLHMKRKIYGESNAHPEIAKTLINLGSVWSDLGDYRKAASYFEQSVQMMRSIYGEDHAHPDIAKTLYNLGGTCMSLGDNRTAISYYEQSLMMWRSIYGEDTKRPDVASALNNLGVTWMGLGDYRTAISYYEQSLKMWRSIHGKNTAQSVIANILFNLGTVWSELGDYRKSVSYHEQSLRMRQSVYGEDAPHPDITLSLYHLSIAWENLGDHSKAVNCLSHVMGLDWMGSFDWHAQIYGHIFTIMDSKQDLTESKEV